MANLTLTIGGRPLKIQCSDNNVEAVKEIASTISKLIEDEKKEKILQDSLNKKLFYESRIQELQNENHNLKSDIEQIFKKLNDNLIVE